MSHSEVYIFPQNSGLSPLLLSLHILSLINSDIPTNLAFIFKKILKIFLTFLKVCTYILEFYWKSPHEYPTGASNSAYPKHNFSSSPKLDIDLKQVDCQLFLQQKWVYTGSTKNCNSGPATMASHMQVRAQQREAKSFKEGKRKLGGL